jgi:hypothetical protein
MKADRLGNYQKLEDLRKSNLIVYVAGDSQVWRHKFILKF